MGEVPSPLGAVGLSPLSEQVYLFVVHRGRTMTEDVAKAFGVDGDAAATILDELRDVGLIAMPEVPGGAYAPVDPQIALGAVVDRLNEQAAVLRDRIPALVEQFRSSASTDHEAPTSLLLTDPVEVASWYARLQHEARSELLTFDRPPYVSLGMEPLQVGTIARGVSWRVVYAAESFARDEAWDETVRMSEQGEQARVASSLPFKLVVKDRSIALLGLRLDGVAVEAMVTESPPLVALLVDTFESYWARALSLGPDGASTTAEIHQSLEDNENAAAPVPPTPTHATRPTREEQAILALIGAGLTDEVIAARLGLSARSLRRRSQQLMRDLGADNRFQLGVEAARRGWV